MSDGAGLPRHVLAQAAVRRPAAAPRPRGGWIDGAAVNVPLDAEVEVRAGELVALGVRPLDALHVAFAERAVARWFVTCDDELLKLAGRLGDALRTLVVAPRALA